MILKNSIVSEKVNLQNSKVNIIVSRNLGKKIVNLKIERNILMFVFQDSEIHIWDDNQSCCEDRYMHTDDKLSDFIGSILQGIEVRDGPIDYTQGENGQVDCQFLLIHTNIGTFTIVNYNDHNGYYGGFIISALEMRLS